MNSVGPRLIPFGRLCVQPLILCFVLSFSAYTQENPLYVGAFVGGGKPTQNIGMKSTKPTTAIQFGGVFQTRPFLRNAGMDFRIQFGNEQYSYESRYDEGTDKGVDRRGYRLNTFDFLTNLKYALLDEEQFGLTASAGINVSKIVWYSRYDERVSDYTGTVSKYDWERQRYNEIVTLGLNGDVSLFYRFHNYSKLELSFQVIGKLELALTGSVYDQKNLRITYYHPFGW